MSSSKISSFDKINSSSKSLMKHSAYSNTRNSRKRSRISNSKYSLSNNSNNSVMTTSKKAKSKPPPSYSNTKATHSNVDYQLTKESYIYHDLKKQLIIFCQNTSMRGLPRIVKTDSQHLKTLWITFVAALFIGLLIAMIFLTNQYFEYNVIHPPVILNDQSTPFPSFTFCNLRPISRKGREILKNNSWRNPREFLGFVNYWANQRFFTPNPNENKTLYKIFTAALSMNGYLESLPFDSVNDLGHSLNDMVVNCVVQYEVGKKQTRAGCGKIGYWKTVIHALYLNCHTYTVKSSIRNQVRTLLMYLYLDEGRRVNQCIDCFLFEIKSQLSGALAVIHAADTYPDINLDSVNLQPGTLTEFNLEIIQNKNKRPPYGICSNNYPPYLTLYNNKYHYSEQSCKLYIIQKQINNRCGCNSYEYPLFNVTLPFCTSMPSFLSKSTCLNPKNSQCLNDILKTIEKIRCKNDITEEYRSDFVKNCTLPCEYYSYKTERSTSTWPTKSFHLTWISAAAVRKLTNKTDFKPYVDLVKQMKINKTMYDQAFEKLESMNLIERNLLGISVNRPNNKVHVVEEKEVLSLTSYLSQIGGLLSIFVGLSIITVVELIELLIQCVTVVRNSWKQDKIVKVLRQQQINSQKPIYSHSRKQKPAYSELRVRRNDDKFSSQIIIDDDYKGIENQAEVTDVSTVNPDKHFQNYSIQYTADVPNQQQTHNSPFSHIHVPMNDETPSRITKRINMLTDEDLEMTLSDKTTNNVDNNNNDTENSKNDKENVDEISTTNTNELWVLRTNV